MERLTPTKDISDAVEICERCDGTGTMKLTGFIHYAPSSTERSGFVRDKPMRCTGCDGNGHITGWTLKMRRIGKYVTERRKELDLSEREMAKLLGMEFMDFHYLMRGKQREANHAS